jgi:hypothetical protein
MGAIPGKDVVHAVYSSDGDVHRINEGRSGYRLTGREPAG